MNGPGPYVTIDGIVVPDVTLLTVRRDISTGTVVYIDVQTFARVPAYADAERHDMRWRRSSDRISRDNPEYRASVELQQTFSTKGEPLEHTFFVHGNITVTTAPPPRTRRRVRRERRA